MEWAISGRFEGVAFVCCCVDPDALYTAVDFERNYFAGAPPSLLNVFIDDRADFPRFETQLGCQGFVVFDAARSLKVPATLPWSQHRDGAFHDLERVLRVMDQNHNFGNALPETTMQKGNMDAEPASIVVDSVGHPGMDSEHERCAVALRSLQDKLSVQTLRAARAELLEHFQHEETMLRVIGFGASGDKSSLSAFDGHIKDHNRIVGIADAALSKLDSACDTSEGAVPKHVSIALAKAFVEHATLYDALYVGKI